MRSDGDDDDGARSCAAPDHQRLLFIYFYSVFFPPLDCEDESGALDHCWFIRVGFGLTSWSVDPTDQNPRCTQSCKAALHQIFFMLTFVFLLTPRTGWAFRPRSALRTPFCLLLFFICTLPLFMILIDF
jgi:hypothetical protein